MSRGKYIASPPTLADGELREPLLTSTGKLAVDIGTNIDLDIEAADLGVNAEGAALGVGVLMQGDDGTDRTNLAVDTDGHLQVDVVTGASDLSAAMYTDDADWTNDSSKHLLVGGVYQATRHAVTDGDVGPLAIDTAGRLVVIVDGSLRVALTQVVNAASVSAAASCAVNGALLTYCRQGIVVVSCNKAHTVEYMMSAAVEDDWTHGYFSDWQKVTGLALTAGAGRVMAPVDLQGYNALGVKLTNNDPSNAATVSIWIGGRS